MAPIDIPLPIISNINSVYGNKKIKMLSGLVTNANDSFNPLIEDKGIYTIEVYSVDGTRLVNLEGENLESQSVFEIGLNQFKSGAYYYIIEFEKTIYHVKFLV